MRVWISQPLHDPMDGSPADTGTRSSRVTSAGPMRPKMRECGLKPCTCPKMAGAQGLSPAPLIRFLCRYTYVQVSNMRVHAEDSDDLQGAIGIRWARVNIDIGIIDLEALCFCSICSRNPLSTTTNRQLYGSTIIV